MDGPHTAREALIAELLGDVDRLLMRVEALPGALGDAEQRLAGMALALDIASDRFRDAVTVFSEQAKRELADYVDRKAMLVAEASGKAVEEQRAALQEAAVLALHSVLQEPLAKSAALPAGEKAGWRRFLEHATTALLASGFTAGLVYLLIR